MVKVMERKTNRMPPERMLSASAMLQTMWPFKGCTPQEGM